MEQIVVILKSGVVIVGKPVGSISAGLSLHGRRLELANATVFQGGAKTATAGHLEIDGGDVASVGDRGITAR